MNFFSRISRAWAALTNRYEAAVHDPVRSWVPAFYQDARLDADQLSRQEMARKIRYFDRNLWLVRRLRSVDVKYSVGANGMPVIPASPDNEWNKRMADAYEKWCESPGLDTLLPMSQLHTLMGGTAHIDGEVFPLMTYRKQDRRQSVPAVQLVESHRVETPGRYGLNTDDSVVDGVKVDGDGRPVGYWVRDGLKGEQWVFRDASRCLQVGDPDRIGMYRYVTPYHAVLNAGHDLDDLERFEMERAKNNASKANVIVTDDGEVPPAMRHQAAYWTGTPNLAGSTESADAVNARLAQYQKVLGARTMALKRGESIEQIDTQNPSAATQWYWLHKIQQLAVSVNIPLMLVFPESIQGTVARAVLDDAHQSFRAKFAVHARAARAMYRHFAQWAIYNIPTLADPPADWDRCSVIPPRACNVDYGRNSAAMLAELIAGTTSWDDIYGANGSTAEVGLRKKGMNVALIKRLAREISAQTGEQVDPAEIAGPLGDVLAKLAEAEAARAQAEAAESAAESAERQQQQQQQKPKRREAVEA